MNSIQKPALAHGVPYAALLGVVVAAVLISLASKTFHPGATRAASTEAPIQQNLAPAADPAPAQKPGSTSTVTDYWISVGIAAGTI